MPYNLLLLPLLGGYLFLRQCKRTRYFAARLDGYLLLLNASVAGVVLLFAAHVLLLLIRPAIRSFGIAAWWHDTIPFDHAAVSILAFCIGAVAWMPVNLIAEWRDDTEMMRAARAKDDPLEVFLRKAMLAGKRVLVTLKSKRVYEGMIVHIPLPGRDVDSIRLVRFQTGYRNEQHGVHFTIDYREMLSVLLYQFDQDDGLLSPPAVAIDLEDMVIVIRGSEIESVSLFHQQLHDLHQAVMATETAA